MDIDNPFTDKMRAELAFRYWKDSGAPDGLAIVASYMKVDESLVEQWYDRYDWEQKLHQLTTSYGNLIPLEQTLREETLKNIGLVDRGVQQYLMTMFKKDELEENFLVDDNGELILQDHLIIRGSKELTAAIKAFKTLTDMKMNILGGIITKEERTVLEDILEAREENKWNIFRTIRECELTLGKIPEFLRLEAIAKGKEQDEDLGDVNLTIELPPQDAEPKDITDAEVIPILRRP